MLLLAESPFLVENKILGEITRRSEKTLCGYNDNFTVFSICGIDRPRIRERKINIKKKRCKRNRSALLKVWPSGEKKSRNRYTNGVRSASSKSYKETSVMEYECKRIDM